MAVLRLESKNDRVVPEMKWIATKTRLHGLLTSVSEELSDVPLFYILPDLCHILHCSCPPLLQVKAALVNAGYQVSAYHKELQAIKTDAPLHVLWDIMRSWCKEHPSKASSKRIKPEAMLPKRFLPWSQALKSISLYRQGLKRRKRPSDFRKILKTIGDQSPEPLDTNARPEMTESLS
jgi:hypothetical protein